MSDDRSLFSAVAVHGHPVPAGLLVSGVPASNTATDQTLCQLEHSLEHQIASVASAQSIQDPHAYGGQHLPYGGYCHTPGIPSPYGTYGHMAHGHMGRVLPARLCLAKEEVGHTVAAKLAVVAGKLGARVRRLRITQLRDRRASPLTALSGGTSMRLFVYRAPSATTRDMW